MTYPDPVRLTCPGGDKTATVIWVVGAGPNTKQGDGPPAYLSLKGAGGPWTPKTEVAHPYWVGRLICPPDCGGAQVLHMPEAAKE